MTPCICLLLSVNDSVHRFESLCDPSFLGNFFRILSLTIHVWYIYLLIYHKNQASMIHGGKNTMKWMLRGFSQPELFRCSVHFGETFPFTFHHFRGIPGAATFWPSRPLGGMRLFWPSLFLDLRLFDAWKKFQKYVPTWWFNY